MKFEEKRIKGFLIRRYKRFLADVTKEDGTVVTAHVPNTGSMTTTCDPGSSVVLSYHPDPKRKLKWTLELVLAETGAWVGVNTSLPNRIVKEAIENKRIPSLRGYDTIRREVPYDHNSRIDLLLEKPSNRCYVEVKNVTYKKGKRALFPDAVTARGLKHLLALERMVKQGHRAVIFFLVNRNDCTSMGPAGEIDPKYKEALTRVSVNGVEMLAYRTAPSLEGIEIDRKVPIVLTG